MNRIKIEGIVEKAKRSKAWFKLSKLSKGIIALALKLKVKFIGEEFLKALKKSLDELLSLVNPIYNFYLKGKAIAYKYSEIAYKWGNRKAILWRYDDNYCIYLGIVGF
ncbi:hypothetical protein HRbin06_00207 [archaeon HR06]|nr:hypothetical protein HRbin06_00207 [archaeon HR06]